jgi:serine/threonine protein kinase
MADGPGAADSRVLNGRYRLTDRLGVGGMGSVWLADDQLLERSVALKELMPHTEMVSVPEQRARVVQEARALARVRHPSVVPIYDVFFAGEDPWIVMEYVRGRPLADLIRDERTLDERFIARIGRDVLRGLMAVHRAGVVHLDVKPTNILVDEDGSTCLVDFGIAGMAGDPSMSGQSIWGTLDFIPPERLRAGATVGPAADIWALGVTFYFALEGHAPFRREDEPGPEPAMRAMLNEPPSPLSRDGRLADITMRMLEKDPAARADAEEVLAVLEELADAGPLDPEPGSGTHPGSATGWAPVWRTRTAVPPDGAYIFPDDQETSDLRETLDYRHGPSAGAEAGQRLDPDGVAGVQVGDHNVQHNYFYFSQQDTGPNSVGERPPYRGLAPFEGADRGIFFGRDDAIDAVILRLAEGDSGIVVVSGSSGVGKSSLLRAGVLPRLSRVGLPGNPGARTWPRLLFTPGARPLDELALQVAVLAGTSGEETRRSLAANPQLFGGLARQAVLAQARQHRPQAPADLGARPRLVLVVDQFEQVFRRCRDDHERRAFITALESAATAAEPSVLVVLVVRSDHESRCAAYPQLDTALRDRYVVQPMTESELEQAMDQPARQFESNVLPELRDRLLAEARNSPGALPWLSDALLRTCWYARDADMLRLADYERAGDLLTAAASRAQAVYDDLTEEWQGIVRRLLTVLTMMRVPGGRASAATWDQLHDGMSPTGFLPVLDMLADERIVVLTRVGAEICHRGLLEAWSLLRDAVPARATDADPRRVRRLPRVLFAIGTDSDDASAPSEAEIAAIGPRLRRGGIAVRSRVVRAENMPEKLATFQPDVVHLVAYDEQPFTRDLALDLTGPGPWSPEMLLRAMQDRADSPRLVIVWLCGRPWMTGWSVNASALGRALTRDPGSVPVLLVAPHLDPAQRSAFTANLLRLVLRGVPLTEAVQMADAAWDEYRPDTRIYTEGSTRTFVPDGAWGPVADAQLLGDIDERINALDLVPPAVDGSTGPFTPPVTDGVDVADRLLDAGVSLKVLMASGRGGRTGSAESGLLLELAAHAVRAGALPVMIGPFIHERGSLFEPPHQKLVFAVRMAISATRRRLGLPDPPGLGPFSTIPVVGPSFTLEQLAGTIRHDLLSLVAELPAGDPVWARAEGEPQVMLLCHCADDWQGPVGSLLEMLGPAGLMGGDEPIPVVLAGAHTLDLMDALPRFLDKPWSVAFSIDPSPDEDDGTADEADEIRELAAAGDYRLAGERLARLSGADPAADGALRLELGFIGLLEPDRGLVATAWSAIAAGRTVESLLGEHDGTGDQAASADVAEAVMSPVAEAAEAAATAPNERAPADGRPRRSAQESGAALEQATVALFERFFAVDEDAMLSRLRGQRAGAQFGHDIELDATVAGSPAVRVHVECKDLSRPVTVHDIAGKLAQQRYLSAGAPIDHWILISPHQDCTNELAGMLEAWTAEYPFSVQLWSPETRVRELFALEPAVYEAVYGRPPSAAEVAGSAEAAALTRQRLAPRLRVDAVWRRYLAEPDAFCFVNENSRLFDGLYARHLPLNAADESGGLLGRTLMDHVIGWAGTGGSETTGVAPPMLLLADFGEGKSVFTYCLTRRLAEIFVAAPDGALFALRIPLREFRAAGSARGLLERRLAEIGATVADWRALTRQVPTLVILDGFDEMSADLTPAAITANLRDIESCIDELRGSKVLVTSRQRVLDGSRDWRRTLDRLGQPLVARIAPGPRRERVKYLEQFATDEASARTLANLRSLYDPIGLAAKPLFLEMIKDTLRELPGDTFSETILYDTYINKSLRTKADLLADPDEELTKGEVIDNLKEILEDVAVRLQQDNLPYLYLKDYQDRERGKIAELLWRMRDQSAGRDSFSLAEQDDAANRVGIRSLLRAVQVRGADPERWPVDFFHRSLREYFVARAIAHAVTSNPKKARRLLSAAPLLPEVAHFAAIILRSETSEAARATLEKLARSASVAKASGGYLGGNALTLLHGAGAQLSERDWAGLCLDHARLRGADLTGACLAGSTLRHANLDNVNLEDADLTGADLEGVRLEETSRVLAVTALDGMRIIAAYEDRSLREWRGRPGAGWESRLITTLNHQADRLQVTPSGRVLASGEGMFSVLELTAAEDGSAGAGGSGEAAIVRCAFRTSSRCRAAVLGIRTSLFVEERDGGRLRVTWLNMATLRADSEFDLEQTVTAWTQWNGVRYAFATSAGIFVDGPDGPGDRVFVADAGVTCLAIRADGGLLVAGHQDGSVSLTPLGSADPGSGAPAHRPGLHEGPVTDIFLDAEERVITGGSDRSVRVVPVSAIRSGSPTTGSPTTGSPTTGGQDSDVPPLQLTLRCRGVRFDGVQTEREREKLRRYAESAGA